MVRKVGEFSLSDIFFWIEDRKGKASYTFWETLLKQLCPNVIVESKKNNSELVKAVKNLSDKENQYIILFDNSLDNVQLYQEQRMLKKCVAMKKNVKLMNIICFEYVLLEFQKLIQWIYAPEDEFLSKRAKVIDARGKLIESITIGNFDYKGIREIVEYDKHLENHNIEQLCAKILFDLTRNTGFEVSKGSIGECWIKSCCEWSMRQEDDICGLQYDYLSIKEKMRQIFYETSLKEEFEKLGLEIVE